MFHPYAPVRITSVQLVPGAGTNELRSEPPPGWSGYLKYLVSLLFWKILD